MKNPEKTSFNKELISSWSKAKFEKWWKLLDFDGNVGDWYYKITGKKKKSE